MHACGHDFHMTIALGALTEVVENRMQDDILFIFQPAEEGPGGAEPMQTSDFFQQHRPDIIFALHIDPHCQLEQLLRSQEFSLRIRVNYLSIFTEKAVTQRILI